MSEMTKAEHLRPGWKPGQSGTPQGRPRGSRNRVNLPLRVTGHVRLCTPRKEMMMATRAQKKPATPDGNDARKSVDLTCTSLEDSWTKIAQLVASPALAASRAIQAVEGERWIRQVSRHAGAYQLPARAGGGGQWR
jgi:hypothetical protein